MIQPELRGIDSGDLEPPELPPDPADCAVRFTTLIGAKDGEEAEVFVFTVTTPAYLGRTLGHTWGRGYLILDVFDWQIIVRAVAQLLAQCSAPTWREVVAELDRELVRKEPSSTTGEL